MRYTPIYLGIAKDELEEAVEYYESVREGDGKKFIEEYERIINLVLMFPHMYQLVHKDKRRAILQKFPRHVIYEVFENDKIVLVLGVVHEASDPKKWQKR